MAEKIRSKWQVRTAAVVIFVLGFIAGMLALQVYRGWARRPSPENRIEQLANRLQLNADQKTKVQQIFSDTREQLQTLRKESEPRVAEIRQQADQRMQQVLTPEQWQKFQQMRSEQRGRRDRRDRGQF
jgi:Spy/CpxP family protein refolding chaperone